MSNAMAIGLTLSDIKELTIGMIYDLIIEKHNSVVRANKRAEEKKVKKNRVNVRQATQADFDRL
jgi:hypothetical protein